MTTPELVVRPIMDELMAKFGVSVDEAEGMVFYVVETTDWENADDVRRYLKLALIDDLEKRVNALEKRDALLTEAIRRLLLGNYEGVTGAAADVVALQGGKDDVTGHVRVPTF